MNFSEFNSIMQEKTGYEVDESTTIYTDYVFGKDRSVVYVCCFDYSDPYSSLVTCPLIIEFYSIDHNVSVEDITLSKGSNNYVDVTNNTDHTISYRFYKLSERTSGKWGTFWMRYDVVLAHETETTGCYYPLICDPFAITPSGYEGLYEILNDIADALREKLGSSEPIDAQDFSTLIRSL